MFVLPGYQSCSLAQYRAFHFPLFVTTPIWSNLFATSAWYLNSNRNRAKKWSFTEHWEKNKNKRTQKILQRLGRYRCCVISLLAFTFIAFCFLSNIYSLHKCYTAVETGSFSALHKKNKPIFFSGVFSVIKNEQVHPQLVNALSPHLIITGIKRSLMGLLEKSCF